MDAQGVINVIFGVLMALAVLIGGMFLLAKACDNEWDSVIGAVTGAIMTASLYGIYVIWNLLHK